MESNLFVASGSAKEITDEILRTFARKRSDSASRDASRAFDERDEERETVQKALSIDEANLVSTGDTGIEPPYPPEALEMVYEHSSALRPCVDAYVANIDGTGHRFSPLLDLDSDDAESQVSDAILVERHLQTGDPLPAAPSDEEVSSRIDVLRIMMKLEKARLESFFNFLCYDISFVTLRRRTRSELETIGNAYWEIVRDEKGMIATAEHVSAKTVRLTKLDQEPQQIKQRIMTGPLTWSERSVTRQFRRFVQRVGTRRQWFKELGDPRTLSSTTGRFYASPQELAAAEPTAKPANEILHFSVWSSRTPYGVPRWIGALVSVLGARASEEVNFLYFDNKSVPPLAVLVSGGRITAETRDAIQAHIENLKGRENFNAILVIETDSDSGSVSGMGAENRTKVEIKSLTEAQHDDALFQAYEEQSGDKVGMQFRLPRMLRGIDKGYNRSTSESALLFGEQQVFGPERDEFDFIINRRILPELKIGFFLFKSNAPGNMAPEVRSKIIRDLTNASVLTPAEARNFTEQVFGVTLRRIDEPWTQQPIGLTIAGIGADLPDSLEPFGSGEDSSQEGEDDVSPDGEGEAGGTAPPKKKPKLPPKPQERGPAEKRGRLLRMARVDARYLLSLKRELQKAERLEHVRVLNDERERDNRDR